jgi:hypothetical protein
MVKSNRSLVFRGKIQPSLGIFLRDLTAPLVFCSEIRSPLMVYSEIQPSVAVFRRVFFFKKKKKKNQTQDSLNFHL